MILTEGSEDLEEANKKHKPTRIRSKDGAVRFNWFHPEHGEVLNCTGKEVREKFPMLKLRTSSLYEVSRGGEGSPTRAGGSYKHHTHSGAVESQVEG